MIDETGKYTAVRLGSNHNSGEVFQFTIPHGTWFAASVNEADSFALLGCTVAPGFHYDDFELGERKKLVKLFPKHERVIREFTRK